MASSPDFVLHRRGRSSIWVVGPCAPSEREIDRLADADGLFAGSECQIVKDQRKIKVARIRMNLGGFPRTLYVKRYNVFSWRIYLGSLFLRSGALRALRGAEILARGDISGAKPVAAVEERRWGMVSASFFFTEEVADGKTIDVFWRENLAPLAGNAAVRRRRKFLRALGVLFRSLHERGVYHADLKDANILAVAPESEEEDCFFLLDLEGVRKYARLSVRRRIKNLVQLNRTFGRHMRRVDKLVFLREYMAPAFSQRRQKRSWISRLLRRSARLDRRKLAAGKA